MKYEKIKLSDLVDTVSDTRKINKDKVVLINTSDIFDGDVLNHSYADNSNLRGQFKKRFEKNDILYSEIRPANKRFAYVDFDSEDYIASTKLMVLRKRSNSITNRFLYYCLTNDFFTEKMQHLAEVRSGTFPQITFDVLKNESINVPSIENQNKITMILDNINNKIKSNNEINNNLEEQLRLFFEEDILKKLNNENTYECSLYDQFDVIDNRGKTPPLVEYSKYPIIDVKVLSGTERVINYNNCLKYVSKETYDTFFRSGHPKLYDTLLSTVGSLAELKIYLENIGTIAQNVVALRPKNDYPLFMYQYILSLKQRLTSYDIGSVQPSIKVTQFMKEIIKIPKDKDLIYKFENLANANTFKMKNLMMETRYLEQLRDTLLPKLMNGEIDLDNIEI